MVDVDRDRSKLLTALNEVIDELRASEAVRKLGEHIVYSLIPQIFLIAVHSLVIFLEQYDSDDSKDIGKQSGKARKVLTDKNTHRYHRYLYAQSDHRNAKAELAVEKHHKYYTDVCECCKNACKSVDLNTASNYLY